MDYYFYKSRTAFFSFPKEWIKTAFCTISYSTVQLIVHLRVEEDCKNRLRYLYVTTLICKLNIPILTTENVKIFTTAC